MEFTCPTKPVLGSCCPSSHFEVWSLPSAVGFSFKANVPQFWHGPIQSSPPLAFVMLFSTRAVEAQAVLARPVRLRQDIGHHPPSLGSLYGISAVWFAPVSWATKARISIGAIPLSD
jgi:hypothetical protein